MVAWQQNGRTHALKKKLPRLDGIMKIKTKWRGRTTLDMCGCCAMWSKGTSISYERCQTVFRRREPVCGSPSKYSAAWRIPISVWWQMTATTNTDPWGAKTVLVREPLTTVAKATLFRENLLDTSWKKGKCCPDVPLLSSTRSVQLWQRQCCSSGPRRQQVSQRWACRRGAV